MRLRPLLAILGVGAVVVAAGRVRRYEVAEQSMEPALATGDYLLGIRPAAPPIRGDIVVYPHPDRTDFLLIKRVVGLPGESVGLELGIVSIDHRTLEEPWAVGAGSVDGRWLVGPDQVFVVGDDRSRSRGDSTTLGPIPCGRLQATIRFRYWPPSRIGRVGTRPPGSEHRSFTWRKPRRRTAQIW